MILLSLYFCLTFPFAAFKSHKADRRSHKPGAAGGEPYAPVTDSRHRGEQEGQPYSADDLSRAVYKSIACVARTVQKSPHCVDNAQCPVEAACEHYGTGGDENNIFAAYEYARYRLAEKDKYDENGERKDDSYFYGGYHSLYGSVRPPCADILPREGGNGGV